MTLRVGENDTIWSNNEFENPLNPEVEAKITSLIASMTLPQKVGQVIQAEISSASPKEVRDYHLGGILNGGGSYPYGNQNATVKDWHELAQSYHVASRGTSPTVDGNSIPVLWGTDAIRGHNNLKGATLFPHNIGLGAANNPEIIYLIGQATARKLVECGIRWTFAPTLAVPQNMRWGRTYEGYSSLVDRVSALSSMLVKGLQEPLPETADQFGVLATLKHFIGDGGTQDGIDQGNTLISEEILASVHAPPYFSGFKSGARVVMASFSSWNDEPLHGHHYLLTEILKNKIGFTGFVVGDWNGHRYLPGCTPGNAPDAINAGLDMFMAPFDWKELHRNLIAQTESGIISIDRLEDAVRRILRVKTEIGLLDPGAQERSRASISHTEQSKMRQSEEDLAAFAVRSSLVLLKNETNALPIRHTKTLLVAGEFANSVAAQCGGWSLTWQGNGLNNTDFPQGKTILDGIRQRAQLEGISVIYNSKGEFSNREITQSTHVVWVYGEQPYAEMQGDLVDMALLTTDDVYSRLASHAEQGLKVTSVLLSGRPLWINRYINVSDAFVAAWLPGTRGDAVADGLFGFDRCRRPFEYTGTLPYPWPKKSSSAEVNIPEALFKAGYGLKLTDIQPAQPRLDEQVDDSSEDRKQIIVFKGRSQNGFLLSISDESQNNWVDTGVTIDEHSVQCRVCDDLVQADAREIQWRTSGRFTLRRIAPLDLNTKNGFLKSQVVFRIFVTAGLENLSVFAGNDSPATRPSRLVDLFPDLSLNQWHQLSMSIPLHSEANSLVQVFNNALTIVAMGPALISFSNCFLQPLSISQVK